MLFLLVFCLQAPGVEVQKPEEPPPTALERLYPIGVEVISLADGAIKAVRKVMRGRAETRARAIVQQELKRLLEAREKAGNDR
jgi:hypothetical protein